MHLVNGYNPWIVNIAYHNCPFLCVPSKTFLSGQNQSEKFLWQLLKAIIRAVKHKFDLEIVLKECGATEAVGDSYVNKVQSCRDLRLAGFVQYPGLSSLLNEKLGLLKACKCLSASL